MNVHNKNVASQYNTISTSFDNSRVRIWNNVKHFLNDKKDGETLLDCGCGNGKNMIYAKTLGYLCEGCDISENLLYICNQKGLDVFYQDVLNLKTNKKYNKILSIAVIHHLETFDEQISAIRNLCDSLCENGKLLISLWSMEKSFNELNVYKSDCRNFALGANYVDWKLNNHNIIKRYYYIHDYNSVNELAKSIEMPYIKYKITWEEQNWFIIFSYDKSI
jgi:2-polyprenyl-3-methyl-5-hydroxy-6-metoxy-1,4-benzoquinol methylase